MSFIFIFFWPKTNAEFVEASLIPVPNEILFDHEADLVEKEKHLKKNKKKNYVVESYTQKDIALFEESFAQAPLKVKALTKGILNQEEYTARFKNILLAGPAGSGKTVLAQAIAYHLKRKCIVVHAPSLLGHYRDQAAENIRSLFEELDSYAEKPVLVMDEMNALTDDHTSEHSDGKHTAMQLWSCLDKYKNDKSFLFIGTTNITKKMPHQLQSRFKGRTFLIEHPSFEARLRAIKFSILALNAQTDQTCNDQYLKELAFKTECFSQRDIEALIDVARLIYASKNPNSRSKLTKDSLEEAYSELKQENANFWDFNEQTTDEERRHRENLAQSKQQFEDSKETQIRIAEWSMIYQIVRNNDPHPGLANELANLNKAKRLALPGKNPAAKLKVVPETGPFWNRTNKEEKLVPYDEQ